MDSKSTAFICIFVFRGNRCDKIYSLIRFFSENTFKNNMLFCSFMRAWSEWVIRFFISNNRFIRGPYVIPKNMSLHLFEYLLKYPYKVSQKKTAKYRNCRSVQIIKRRAFFYIWYKCLKASFKKSYIYSSA